MIQSDRNGLKRNDAGVSSWHPGES